MAVVDVLGAGGFPEVVRPAGRQHAGSAVPFDDATGAKPNALGSPNASVGGALMSRRRRRQPSACLGALGGAGNPVRGVAGSHVLTRLPGPRGGYST